MNKVFNSNFIGKFIGGTIEVDVGVIEGFNSRPRIRLGRRYNIVNKF